MISSKKVEDGTERVLTSPPDPPLLLSDESAMIRVYTNASALNVAHVSEHFIVDKRSCMYFYYCVFDSYFGLISTDCI